jgi:hypothetical protein
MFHRLNFLGAGFTFFISLLVFCQISYPQNKSYYVDSNNGSDANTGTDSGTPWQTLSNVNAKTFLPGDKILLKSGSVWSGQLSPKGSGAAGSPITIDMYGGTVKPRIDGGGTVTTGVVYLLNQEYWEINNLEVTNNAASQAYNRRGVLISVSLADSVIHHIYLKNLWVHDVMGTLGSSDADVSAKRTGGIGIESTVDGGRYDSVWVDGCEIDSVVETGIWIYNSAYSTSSNYPVASNASWYKNRITNLRITNNEIHHVAKNGMIIRLDDSGIIEHNVCYETALQTTGNTMFTASCNGTVFQFNEGYYNRSTGADGSMYDADLRSPNVIFQYSYSHDNAHGLFWTCTDQQDSGIICRYNISQNDKGNIFCINYPNTSVYCYNNTVYCGASVSPVIISERNVNSGTRKYYFYNNIIYNNSSSASYQYTTSGYTRTIDYNLYYGNHPSGEPSDSHKLTSDPLLNNPGNGGTGISTVDGYKIASTSPAKGSGYLMFNHCTQDFWGNAVSSPVDRGANQAAAVVSTPSVTTSSVASITFSSATCGGTVTSDGGATVTSKGICFNTSGSPTLSDDYTIDGSGTGSFTSSLASLSAGTTYYVRAYAVNSIGVSYGTEISFTTRQISTVDSVYWALTASQACTSGLNVNGASQVLSSGGGVLSLSIKDYNAGTTAGGERLYLGSTKWPTETGQNDSRYVEFAIAPAAQYDFTVSSIPFGTGYSGTTGHMFANVYYSLDSWATRTKLNTDSIVIQNSTWNSPVPTYSTNILIPTGDTLAVRIYPWYNTTPSSTRYISLKNFTIGGTSSVNSAYLKGNVSVKGIQQGFYNTSDRLNCSDTIKVLLANAASPHAYVDSTLAILDSLTFTSLATFNNASTGSYYLIVKHRNCIETWSAGTIAFAKGSTASYDFTDAQSKAYGNNLIQVSSSPERWAIYSGDVNQDGYVDPLDIALIDNDSYYYISGNALSTDLNGDRYTDPLDLSIADINSFNYIGIQKPSLLKIASPKEHRKLLNKIIDTQKHHGGMLKH